MSAIRDYFLEIVLTIVSLFLLLLLVLPLFSGYKIQSDYSVLVKALSKGTGLTFEVVSFQRHWFRSDAKLIAKNLKHDVLFEFNHQIIHGPLYLGLVLDRRSPFVNMVIKGSALPGEQLKELSLVVNVPVKKIDVEAYIGFNEDVVANVSISSVLNGYTALNQDKVIELDLRYMSQEGRYQGEVHVPELLLHSRSFFELENFILSFDEVYRDDVLAGDIVLSFDLLKLKINNRIVDFRKVSARVESAIKNSLLDMELDINISKVNLFNEQVNSLSFGLEFDALDVLDINENKMNFKSYTYEMLKIKPFDFYSEHGVFSVNAEVNRDSSPLLDSLSYFSNKSANVDVSLSTSLLRRIYEVVSLNIDVPLQDVDIFIENMLKQNYLKKYSDKVKFKISGKDDALVINDKRSSFGHLSNRFISNILPN